jgi:hypothetical protein
MTVNGAMFPDMPGARDIVGDGPGWHRSLTMRKNWKLAIVGSVLDLLPAVG